MNIHTLEAATLSMLTLKDRPLVSLVLTLRRGKVPMILTQELGPFDTVIERAYEWQDRLIEVPLIPT